MRLPTIEECLPGFWASGWETSTPPGENVAVDRESEVAVRFFYLSLKGRIACYGTVRRQQSDGETLTFGVHDESTFLARFRRPSDLERIVLGV
jgi:hypothetical protein